MSDAKPTHALTEGAIARTLALFALPMLAGNVLQSLNGSVNAVWIGHYLGEAALNASSIANTVLFLLIALVFGIGMAATILVGQAVGANNLDLARRVVGTGATFFVAGSLLIAVAGYASAPTLLDWMRTPPDALPFATAYLRVIFVAIPVIFANVFVTMVLRGAGDSRTPMRFLALAVGLDIALNPLLIFGVGPLPALGIAGSAWATLCANLISLTALLTHLARSRHFLLLRGAQLAWLRPQRALLATLVRKGLPMGLQMIVMSGSAIVMMSLVNRFGSQTAAAFGAAMQLWNYIQMPAMAVGMAVSSMAAQNVGAGRMDRLDRIAGAGVAFSLLLTGVLILVTWWFSRYALGLFLPDDGDALAIGRHLHGIAVWSFLFFGISMVLMGVVRSTGAVLVPLAVLFVSLWLVRIPFAVALLDRWQAEAIWWSFPLGSIVSVLLAAAYYRWGGWRGARMMPAAAT